MAPKLYCTILSPAVRSVLLCAKALDLELELKEVNLATGEHLTPAYLKVSKGFAIDYFYLNLES